MTEELILLVDDEVNITDLVKLYLERESFKTILARNGLELSAGKYDYMTKPINPCERVARVKAILRCSELPPSQNGKSE
jgi:DNA-binding response OmpR family regulator